MKEREKENSTKMLKRGRGRPKKIASDNLVQEMVNFSDGKACSDQLPEYFKLYTPAMYSETMRIPPDFIEKFGGNIPTICTFEIPSGVSWQVDVNKINDDWFFKKGWPEFVQENSIEDGDFLDFSYAGNSTFCVKIFSRNGCIKRAENTSRIDDKPTENLQENEASQPVKAENRINKRARRGILRPKSSIAAKNPSFSLVIRKSYLHKGYQPVPMQFWRLYMKKKDEKGSSMVTLWVNNNAWIVDLKTAKERISFAKGCSKFVTDNSLKIGTLCTFQLIDRNDLAFNVTIHR